MREDFQKIKCDGVRCRHSAIVGETFPTLPIGWQLGEYDLCPDCAIPWWDDLVVSITTRDVKNAGGSTRRAINRKGVEADAYYTHNNNSHNNYPSALRNGLYKYALNTSDGLVSRINPNTLEIEHSSCSIVRLECPDMNHACNDPRLFIQIYKEIDTHRENTDTGRWNNIYGCLKRVHDAVEDDD